MDKRTLVKGLTVAVVGLGIGSFLVTDAYAWGRSHFDERIVVGSSRYHYRDGRFYRPAWFGFQFVFTSAPVGAVVTSLPFGCRTVFVRGTPYYYYNGVYYRRHASGFIVVPVPVVQNTDVSVGAVPSFSHEAVTINIPNKNGSFTPVTLVRQSNGFIGPQGEYYPDRPTVEQLRVLYGS